MIVSFWRFIELSRDPQIGLQPASYKMLKLNDATIVLHDPHVSMLMLISFLFNAKKKRNFICKIKNHEERWWVSLLWISEVNIYYVEVKLLKSWQAFSLPEKQEKSKAFTAAFSIHYNNNVKWYMKCLILYWTVDLKSSKLWSWQLWTQFKQLSEKVRTSTGFEPTGFNPDNDVHTGLV